MKAAEALVPSAKLHAEFLGRNAFPAAETVASFREQRWLLQQLRQVADALTSILEFQRPLHPLMAGILPIMGDTLRLVADSMRRSGAKLTPDAGGNGFGAGAHSRQSAHLSMLLD